VFGPDGVIVLVLLVATIGVTIWAIVDAARRPEAAFYAARSNKTAWIIVLVATAFMGFGWLLGAFYLLSTRGKVQSHAETADA
jgi:Protein of unknown function (DUF2516)